ncbi:MAG: FlgD immunoglobulin-like domain containing protein [Candidatus Eisenbacteria bacterium]
MYPLFIHVECHVGNDTFQNSETLARGARYGVGGIPHVMIEGTEPYIGASPCEQMIPAYLDGINTSLEGASYISPIDITGGLEINGTSATITANVELLDDVNLPALQVTIFLVENNITWCCGYGGVDLWNEVVRSVRSTAISPTFGGGAVQVQQNYSIGSYNAAELEAYAVVEAVGGSKQVYQATDFGPPIDYFFVQAFDTKIGSAPEGNDTVLFDGFVQNLGLSSDTIDLSIDSAFGWPADFQVEGDSNWYTSHSLVVAAGETKNVTVRVQTDGVVRTGSGTLTATGQAQGQVQSATMKVFNGSPAILMVDDDGTGSYQTPFTDALNSLGYLFDTHTVGQATGPNAAAMNGYDGVVWQTAYLNNPITESEIAALQTYVDNGGNLFLSSMNFLGTQGSGTTFTQDYLGLAGFVNNTGSDVANGVGGDPITDGLAFVMEWPSSAANKTDHLTMGAATGNLTDEDDEFIACRYQLPDGNRTAFNTLCVDAVKNDAAQQAELIEKSIVWILGGGLDPADVGDVDVVSNLGRLSASPNPVVTSAELSFRLSDTAAKESVSLILVDAAGRQVRSLVKGSFEPGLHTLTWDGRDDQGREVAGGVYFGRLETAEGDSQAKIVKVN